MAQRHVLLPQALALALAQHRPSGAGISHLVFGNRLDRCAASVPLDDEGYLALELIDACF